MAPPREEMAVDVGQGITLAVPGRFPSHRNFVVGSYERDLRAALLRFLEPGMAVADVGANIGYYTTLFARAVGPSGRVTAFEPDPLPRAYLERNLEANGLDNVTVVPAAVAAASGVASFVRNDIERGFLGTGGDEIAVPTVTLDDHFEAAGWPPVDAVKLDIESGETQALAGMRELARRNPALVLAVEYNPAAFRRAGSSRGQQAEALRAAGFTDAHIVEQGGRHLPVGSTLPPASAMYNLLVARRPLPRHLFER